MSSLYFNGNYYVTNGTASTSTIVYNEPWVYPPGSVISYPEGAALPEDPIAWLKRRVEETLWYEH